ncbi:hypothetical protein SLS62_005213 [Diatrype stigma]|uniref:Uncharacterized protein n=1 Tax=Diatrype stigma TaxID=117547 RepID=A0AAN9YPX2_9PEZI
MPKQQVFYLHPYGWENDPEEERFKLSTLDYLPACSYLNFALFFKLDDYILDDEQKGEAVEILKLGLERTISQVRHVCGTIEKDEGGGHTFAKKKDSTVKFVVQHLDSPDDENVYPSFEDIEKKNFTSAALGDLRLWSADPIMTWGGKPEAHPDRSPPVAAFKVNLIQGGIVFNMHFHHYAADVMGWAGFTHQLAEQCKAAFHSTSFPGWDPRCNDLSRLTKPEPAEEAKIDLPPRPQRHPAHAWPSSMYLFHLPKSKAAELKKRAEPPSEDGSWISTYDAFSALIWRTMTRLRAPVYKPDMASSPYWAEAIDMRRRMHSPKVHPRTQRNVISKAASDAGPVPAPTMAEVVSDSEWPLWRLASYVRQLTDSATQEKLDSTLDFVATVHDKTTINVRVDSKPPMSIQQTDHREVKMGAADFGFARPYMYRHLSDFITEGLILVYPPRSGKPGSDEGYEFSITYEDHLVQALIEDPEWCRYFEYRGVEAVSAASLKKRV